MKTILCMWQQDMILSFKVAGEKTDFYKKFKEQFYVKQVNLNPELNF